MFYIFTKSQQNKDLLIKNDFIYRINRTTNNLIYWRCLVYTCRSSLKSSHNYKIDQLSIISINDNHNHDVNIEKVLKITKRAEMREILIGNEKSQKFAMEYVLRGAGIEKIQAAGTEKGVKQMMKRHKRKTFNTGPFDNDLKISEKLKFTHTNQRFYQYGPGHYQGIIHNNDVVLFYIAENIQLLNENLVWCMDGTFCTVPKSFTQLVKISFIIFLLFMHY